MQTTSDYLSGLNQAQREAVMHPVRGHGEGGGPMIVLAGPGTGKTHVLTRRIAYLIEHLGREPSQILAVTFTNKAAEELRSRICGLVGAQRGQSVRCQTFNGYGNSLIDRFSHYLQLPRRRDMIDEVQSRRLLREVILEHNLFVHSRGQGLDTLVGKVESHISAFANAGKNPAECIAAAGAWKQRLDAAGLDVTDLVAQQQKLAFFTDITSAYKEYNFRRHRMGLLSYDDQVLFPLELLAPHSRVGEIIRTELASVIVDEFQDCNPAQLELLRRLIPPSTSGGQPDLTVVGDDDQAIYGFRGSDNRVFQRFDAIWKSASPKVVKLTENHRSQQTIINFTNRVISAAHVRFDDTKMIEFGQGRPVLTSYTNGVTLSRYNDDADVLPAMLLLARSRAQESGEVWRWSDHAVIARTHRDLDRIAAGLELYDIPVVRSQRRGLLDNHYVQDVLAWTAWVLKSEDDFTIVRCLSRPPFNIRSAEILRWRITYSAMKGKKRAQLMPADANDRMVTFEEFLEQIATGNVQLADNQGELSLDNMKAVSEDVRTLVAALTRVKELRVECENLLAQDALLTIIRTSSLGAAQLESPRDRHAHLLGMLELLNIAREKQARLPAPGSLQELHAYLSEWENLHKAASQADIDYEDPRLNERNITSDQEEQGQHGEDGTINAVSLLTAHASKGLEFKTVYVPRVGAHGYPRGYREQEAYLPPELETDTSPIDPRASHHDEERRLFYVACTRAKQYLHLLYAPIKSKSDTNFTAEFHPAKGQVYIDKVTPHTQILQEATAMGMFGVANITGDAVGNAINNATSIDVESARSKRERARKQADRVRSAARLAIAGALERTNAADFDPHDLTYLGEVLRESLDTIAAANFAQRYAQAPSWGTLSPVAAHAADQIAKMHAAAVITGSDEIEEMLKARTPKGPLKLSYTQLYKYKNCPRCWAIHYLLGVQERQSGEASIGSLVHSVLEDHFRKVREADAQGTTGPSLQDVIEITHSEYAASLGPQQSPDIGLMAQLEAQVTAAIKLHSHQDNILELEKGFAIEHTHNGMLHTISGKIDRIDGMPNGRMRIIDYKTGEASKSKLTPPKDDLQLGLYIMALHSMYGELVPSQAEYWVLSSEQRGVLLSENADLDKVAKQVNTVIDGILAGEFARKDTCEGDCTLMMQ